jgi:hypothetical protein
MLPICCEFPTLAQGSGLTVATTASTANVSKRWVGIAEALNA